MGDRQYPSLVLASASPRRKVLLHRLLPRFQVLPSDIPEEVDRPHSPAQLVRTLAFKKAEYVRNILRLKLKMGRSWVLGADTLVFVDRRVLGKPSGHREAERMLRVLSGRWHRVYTGAALLEVSGPRRMVGHELTWVKMRKLSSVEIRQVYRRHHDKAGAYAVQEKNDPLVERIRGEYENVVGLPLGLVETFLKKAGFKTKNQ